MIVGDPLGGKTCAYVALSKALTEMGAVDSSLRVRIRFSYSSFVIFILLFLMKKEVGERAIVTQGPLGGLCNCLKLIHTALTELMGNSTKFKVSFHSTTSVWLGQILCLRKSEIATCLQRSLDDNGFLYPASSTCFTCTFPKLLFSTRRYFFCAFGMLLYCCYLRFVAFL